MLITSVQNKYIKDLVKLKEKKYRDESDVFLVETKHLVLEAYRAGLVKQLILEENDSFSLDVPMLYVSKDVLKKLSSVDSGSNIMAVVYKRREIDSFGKRILVLDRIQDPGNLGTMIRSAVAFNFDSIICSNDTVDVYNPKVVRASQGMMFHLPIVYKNIREVVCELKKLNYKIIGTRVTDGYDVREVSIGSDIVLIIGNEGQGMSKDIEELCDKYLYIKMNSDCESLNASVAASILMYEINNK